jgi:AcrR family transcriptional regulator
MAIPATRSRRHAPAEQRRAQIVEAAFACFAEKGYHATTMDDLVRASGLSKGSLYWHFRSKQDVFLAVFDAFAEALFSDWDAQLAAGHRTLDALDAVLSRTLEGMNAEGRALRAWAEFMAHPMARQKLAEVYRRTRSELLVSLRRDVADGCVRDLPLQGVAAALTAAGEGLLLQAMVDETFDAREHWPVVMSALRSGLSP